MVMMDDLKTSAISGFIQPRVPKQSSGIGIWMEHVSKGFSENKYVFIFFNFDHYYLEYSHNKVSKL